MPDAIPPPAAGCHRWGRRAFTLIEVILVAVVLGLVLVTTVPRFQGTASRLRLEQTATQVAQLLRAAHVLAISQAQPTVWRWDADTHRVRIEPSADDDPEVLLRSAPFPEGTAIVVRQDDAVAECGCVRFFSDGTAEPATLTVTFQGLAYTVSVDGATSQTQLAAGAPAD
jgi:type II secretion system protein H